MADRPDHQVGGVCREVRVPGAVDARTERAAAPSRRGRDAPRGRRHPRRRAVRHRPRARRERGAVRPHNSGHWTMEGSTTTQFENHVRAVLDLPLGATDLVAPARRPVNVFGGPDAAIPSLVARLGARRAARQAPPLWQGAATRAKLGHVTVAGTDAAESQRARGAPPPRSARPSPRARGPGDERSARGRRDGERLGPRRHAPAARCSREFDVAHEHRVVSAHRTPDQMLALRPRGALSRGLRVLIAGAGGAAHLPGCSRR